MRTHSALSKQFSGACNGLSSSTIVHEREHQIKQLRRRFRVAIPAMPVN